MNGEFWSGIYDILVKHCEAPEGYRRSFVDHHCEPPWAGVSEWRFCGNLGFGGKFWRNHGRFYVNYYREDETPEREAAAERANAAIQEYIDKASA